MLDSHAKVVMQVCRGRHSSPAALASAAHTLLFLLYKFPDRTLSNFAAGRVLALLADAVVVVRAHLLDSDFVTRVLYYPTSPQDV